MSWSLDVPGGLPVAVVLALLFAGAIAWGLRELAPLPRERRITLGMLRAAAASIALLLAVQPTCTHERFDEGEGHLAILFDVSRSTIIADEGAETRRERERAIAAAFSSERGAIIPDVIAFGERATPTTLDDVANGRLHLEDDTRLADALRTATAGDVGAVLLVSDGSDHAGGAVQAAPSAVEIDGKQLVLVPTGNGGGSNIGTTLARASSTQATRTASRLVAFALDAKAPFEVKVGRQVPKPPRARPTDKALIAKGAAVYEGSDCNYCHGHDVETANGSIKDLRFASAQTYDTFAGIVIGGLRAAQGMPAHPQIGMTDIDALQAYILDRAWKAYEAEPAKK